MLTHLIQVSLFAIIVLGFTVYAIINRDKTNDDEFK